MITSLVLALASLLGFGSPTIQQTGDETRLLIGEVTVNARYLVFSYAGDIWRVELEGGEALQLTAGPEDDDTPVLSRDGTLIAFSRQGADARDVYLVPTAGGEVQRLTYNPEMDIPRGWTPDDRQVLFMSHRDEEGIFRLYTIPRNGGFPTALPLPRAREGSYSPEGDRIAYVPWAVDIKDWRHYRGGMTAPIWIANLDDSRIERLSRENWNDRFPMWMGDTIYFVSDRDGTYNLYRYGLGSRETEQLTSYEDYGITFASSGGTLVAFVQDGGLRVYNPASSSVDTVPVQVTPDTSQLISRTVPLSPYIESAAISAIGDQVVFEARGDIVSLDRLSGTAINLTSSSGAADRNPALSPDGQWIAYISDASGEYELKIRRADGTGDVLRTSAIELQPTYYRELSWSPDSKRIAFVDKRLSLWIADIETGGARRVSTSPYSDQGGYQAAWSPNGTILAYSEFSGNRNRVIFLYDVVRGRTRQVTPDDVSAEHPSFDPNGKYLYVVTSDNALLSEFGWSVLSGMLLRPLISRRLQVVVLRNDTPAPIYPIIEQPNLEAQADSGLGRALIHTEGIHNRIVPLPVEPRDYAGLVAGKAGELYALVNEWPETPALGTRPSQSLYRYRLAQPKRLEPFLDDIDFFALSADASAVLYRRDDYWAVVPTAEPPDPDSGAGRLLLDSLTLQVDRRAEWAQMYHEAWRLMRDFFYDPNHHGQNIRRLEADFASYLPSIARRSDLNRLLGLALGHISVSHLSVSGGDMPEAAGQPSRVGLLGADYEISEGRYRIRKIYRSGHFQSRNPLLRAPLDQPGMDVSEGEYLLRVDGEPITATRNIHSYFEGKALRPTRVTVGPDPTSQEGARTFTVVPLNGENSLRRWNWAEANRRFVDKQTQGQLRYIYVPNYTWGLEAFFREILAYQNRKGFVIDQRFAGGGVTADYLIETLMRKPIYYYAFRDGEDLAVPTNPMPEAKVLLVNNRNASAAETFALMFKLGGLGRVMGERTFGAGIGPYVYIPNLIDGGRVSIPNRAAYNPGGTWDIENEGVIPNIEVEWLPEQWRRGEDPQLEAAIHTTLQRIVDNAENLVEPKRPDYPVHRSATN